jgi:hypothetical protein
VGKEVFLSFACGMEKETLRSRREYNWNELPEVSKVMGG